MIEAVTETTIRVRYGETDQMGHAYYANYFYWFEVARGAWLRDRGVTYKSIEEMGIMLPVVEAHAEYRGEVKYDDDVVVRIWLAEKRRASIQFKYEVLNHGKVVTTGYTWHVTMSREKRKAVSIPIFVNEFLERDPTVYERLH
ncbi:MAG: acyl-CoA thioesterase [Armatimonadetes bacterium]|nr:acyl-CoA thioesterase [Armatimonadota bacterium]